MPYAMKMFFFLGLEPVQEDVDLQASPVLIRTRKESKPPIFTTDLEDIMTNTTESLTLTCNVAGLPRPDVKWFRYVFALGHTKSNTVM